MPKHQTRLEKYFDAPPKLKTPPNSPKTWKKAQEPRRANSNPLSLVQQRKLTREVQYLVNSVLGVPLTNIVCGTVKRAFDHHQKYAKKWYPTRARQVKKLLADANSLLTIREFWQGVYYARKFPLNKPQALTREVQDLVNRILGVPLADICCGTVKQALDHHPVYAKDLYPTRARQTKQLLKDYDSPLTIREFWQGVYDAQALQLLDVPPVRQRPV